MKPFVSPALNLEATIATAVSSQGFQGGHGWTGSYVMKPASTRDADIQTVPPG